ncbi:class I SAM-dependent methyltransferase [Ramlibacter albus]|uniref:Methyltransferase domain-containing protein n=1 Tax=Ramlibacter albus TaxID=2079448 RepID=A0A923M6J4_9BURK|nr:class I SAM-dependent methyltransferase [Ramlibacter albus]MBC5763634.1 methyltransferase domain-containing protein [Ramlibacter albus]
MSVVRACPLCRSRGSKLLFTNAMAALDALDMSYAVHECAECGFVFAGELPPEPDYSRYYARYSKYDHSSVVSVVDAARGEAAAALIENVVARDAPVVDVGCGSGTLLSLLKRAGYTNLHGVDPAPNAGKLANELFGLTGVRRGSMADCHEVVPIAEASVVMVMAVLEHLWDPQRDMAGLFARLRPGTHLMVDVPALETFDGERGEPFGELSLEHIQYFSRDSLDALMATLGAAPLSHRYVECGGMSGRALLALYQVTGKPGSVPRRSENDAATMRRYLEVCGGRLDKALARVPAREMIVYGAGSHTARLLPQLGPRCGAQVRLLADANPNLQGSRMGGSPIVAPAEIAKHPRLPVLVSSFRFQDEIEKQLAQRYPNELIKLY